MRLAGLQVNGVCSCCRYRDITQLRRNIGGEGFGVDPCGCGDEDGGYADSCVELLTSRCCFVSDEVVGGRLGKVETGNGEWLVLLLQCYDCVMHGDDVAPAICSTEHLRTVCTV